MTNMEDLTKHQLVLLTLLVSFITSIATGIITFTLLSEAPIEVTQNINRIVERTIEQVTPTDGGKTVVKEVQVVSEEDSVLNSIDKVSKSIVKIKTLGFDGNPIIIGTGVVVSNQGTILMSNGIYTTGKNYDVVFSDGKSYTISKTYLDSKNGLVFMKVGKPAGENYTFVPVKFGNSDGLKLGQTMIAIGGKDDASVSIGRISELSKDSGANISKITTDIRTSKNYPGSPILNLSGEVVGAQLVPSESTSSLSYNSSKIIEDSLKLATADLSK